MTAATTALIVTGIQSGFVILLAADKWVHRVTGATSLEAQIKRTQEDIAGIRTLIETANERASEKASKLTVYLDTRRDAADKISERVATIEGVLRTMQNQHADGSLIHERRHDIRRRDQP